jgi:hypothetical protein
MAPKVFSLSSTVFLYITFFSHHGRQETETRDGSESEIVARRKTRTSGTELPSIVHLSPGAPAMAATLRQPNPAQIRRISSQDFASLIDSDKTTRMTTSVSLDKLGAPGTPQSQKTPPPDAGSLAVRSPKPSSDRRLYRNSTASLSSPDLGSGASTKKPQPPPPPPHDYNFRDSYVHVDPQHASDRSTLSGSSVAEGRPRSTSTSAKVSFPAYLSRANF